nr:MAG TPA: hypothetical protein [Caudoviricetes sp.]
MSVVFMVCIPSCVLCIERTFEIPCLNNTTLRNLFQEVFSNICS